MNRGLISAIAVMLAGWGSSARADIVTDWNVTIQEVIQTVPGKANPGLSTRAAAMMNGAIYDVFQAFDRTHQPLVVKSLSPASGSSRDAAIAQAAHDILVDCYEEQETELNALLTSRLAAIGASPAAELAGTQFGAAVAQKYIVKRDGDHSGDMIPYTGPGGIGHWGPDPMHPDQEAWGPGWGTVHTWALPSSDYFDIDAPSGRYEVPGPPALNTDAYRDAYNMVKDYGAVDSTVRTADQTEIGRFWGYDRPTLGPPPVLFVRNLVDIASQTGNTPEENARLFAMASVAIADAAVASWDVKFKDDFWRPVMGIWAGDVDGNPETDGQTDWYPLGAPGPDHDDPNDPLAEDDFTPPFPAYTSGHATMGGALFKSLELFFGTNTFAEIDSASGIPLSGTEFRLFSDEPGSGGSRDYKTFTHSGLVEDLLDVMAPDYSPDAENALSRIFLGIHWIFDQQDGMDLGHAIASYVAENRFQLVPEPSAAALACLSFAGFAAVNRRRRR